MSKTEVIRRIEAVEKRKGAVERLPFIVDVVTASRPAPEGARVFQTQEDLLEHLREARPGIDWFLLILDDFTEHAEERLGYYSHEAPLDVLRDGRPTNSQPLIIDDSHKRTDPITGYTIEEV